MTDTIYDDAIIAAWERALDDRPSEIAEIDLPDLPQVESFMPSVLNTGMVFNMRSRGGGDFAFVINPVAARHLAACILIMGAEAGWLNELGDVLKPAKPPLDS